MKILLATVAAIMLPLAASAQEQSPTTLASTMEVYVFPTEGQDAGQQSMDEATCYDWAATNTGNDPFNLAKESESNEELAAAEMQAAESTGQGSGARTALRGAAAGALIAEVSGGDTSEGAAIGATAGVIRGRRQGRAANAQATEQAEAQAETREEANEEDMVNFKNAFSVCLEAKEYMVKY
jgi:hypothetical protein